MSPIDVVVLLVIAVAFVAAVRSVMRSNADGCSDCGSSSTCAAHRNGGSCKAADDMLAHVESALDAKH